MPGRIGLTGAGVGVSDPIVTTDRPAEQHEGTTGRGVTGDTDDVAGTGVADRDPCVGAARRRASSASSWKNTMLTGTNPPSPST